MELELRHLAPYLPYGLMVQLSQKGIFNLDEEFPQPHNEICEITNILKCNNEWQVEISDVAGNDSFGLIDLEEIIPLLLPMSDLYKEIEGVVGIVELAKIEHPCSTYHILRNKVVEVAGDNQNSLSFKYDLDENYFVNSNFDCDDEYYPIMYQLDLFAYLFEHHYDIYGLIDKGLAIDKTKIK